MANVTIPDKVIVIGGLPRSGKTILSGVLGSHSQIAIPESALNFFHYFGDEDYRSRGGFEENLDFFFESCRKSTSIPMINRGETIYFCPACDEECFEFDELVVCMKCERIEYIETFRNSGGDIFYGIDEYKAATQAPREIPISIIDLKILPAGDV